MPGVHHKKHRIMLDVLHALLASCDISITIDIQEPALRQTLSEISFKDSKPFGDDRYFVAARTKTAENSVVFRMRPGSKLPGTIHQVTEQLTSASFLEILSGFSAAGKMSESDNIYKFRFVTDIKELKYYNFQYFDILPVTQSPDGYVSCSEAQASIWQIVGWYIGNDELKSISLIDCDTEQSAQQLKAFTEIMLSRVVGPVAGCNTVI
jgi:hypothetical protein